MQDVSLFFAAIRGVHTDRDRHRGGPQCSDDRPYLRRHRLVERYLDEHDSITSSRRPLDGGFVESNWHARPRSNVCALSPAASGHPVTGCGSGRCQKITNSAGMAALRGPHPDYPKSRRYVDSWFKGTGRRMGTGSLHSEA